MPIELTALTEPGRHVVTLAEGLADQFATRAAEHDRDASYPHEAIEALHSAGYFTAPIPAQFGGLGTASVHDLVVAASRLARGDASVAIGVNMHMTILRNLVRRWELAVARDDERRAVAFGQTLEAVAYDGTVIASAGSEPQQDLTRPATTATRIDSGWRIDGRKIFCTMSPAATVLFTAVTFRDDDGNDRYGYARVPAGTPGMTVNDDWDALGMRASGSHSVTFDGAEVPASALRGGFPVGSVLPYIEANLTAGLFHAAASLGIAEAAHGTVTEALARRNGSFKEGRGSTLLAESTIDLSAQRAMLSRTATLVDGYYASDADGDPALVQLFAEVQAAKTFVNESATRVVDRALALSGGAGYMAGNPLARHYRDVRAGAFMHPLGSNRAYDVLAQIALSREPALH